MLELALKALLLILTAVSVHLSLSPPNPPVKRERCTGGDTIFERMVQSVTKCSKTMVWIGTLYDFLVMINLYNHHPVARIFCPRGSALVVPPWTVSFILALGAFSTFMGALLRIWCFKTMGQFFTFEVTIQPKHELITSGPYSWVRHPSYTGIYMTLCGATAVFCAPGSALTGCGVLSRGGLLWVGIWVAKCVMVFKGVAARLTAEDAVLQERFGAQWDAYAQKVPNKIVPGLL